MSRPFPKLVCALALCASALAATAADNDRYGDPLPEGAKGRLGTVRLRNTGYATAFLSPDAKTLYVTGPTGVRLIDPVTGAVTGKLKDPPAGNLVGITADGKRALQNTFDGVAVWDLATSKTLAKVTARMPGIDWGVSVSADGKVLAIGGTVDFMKKHDIKVVVRDVDANKEIVSIPVPLNQTAYVALAPDGQTLAIWGSSQYDPSAKPGDQENGPSRFVYFHDAKTGKELSKFRGPGYNPQGAAFGPNGLVAVFAGINTIDLVDPKTGASKVQLLTRARMNRSLTFSPDGSVVAATSDDGAVQMWRAADGARIATIESPVPGVYSARVQMLDNEKGIAWAVRNMATFAWEVPSGKPLGPIDGHTSPVSSIAVTPDGKYALTSADAGTSLRWELATGKLVGEVALKHPNAPAPGYAPGAQFSRDGKLALVRDSFTGAALFDVSTGTQWYAMSFPSFTNSRETFTPDGSKLVIVQIPSNDPKKSPARVQVLDTVTGKRLGEIELPGYSRLSAALSPDGKHLITAGTKPSEKGNDAFVATGWELATGAKKGELTGTSQYYQPQVAAAPDNKTAVVAKADGKVIAFDFLEGKEVRTYEVKGRGHGSLLTLAPDGKRFAVSGLPGFGQNPVAAVSVFDWESGSPVQTINVPGAAPLAMAFTPDGKQLLTSAADTSVTIWDVSK